MSALPALPPLCAGHALELDLLALDGADGEPSAPLEQHLRGCADCRATLTRTRLLLVPAPPLLQEEAVLKGLAADTWRRMHPLSDATTRELPLAALVPAAPSRPTRLLGAIAAAAALVLGGALLDRTLHPDPSGLQVAGLSPTTSTATAAPEAPGEVAAGEEELDAAWFGGVELASAEESDDAEAGEPISTLATNSALETLF